MRCVPGRRAGGTRFFRDGGVGLLAPLCRRRQGGNEARQYTRAELSRAGKQLEHGHTSGFKYFWSGLARGRVCGLRRQQKSPCRAGFPHRACSGQSSGDFCILQKQRHDASTKSEPTFASVVPLCNKTAQLGPLADHHPVASALRCQRSPPRGTFLNARRNGLGRIREQG